MLDFCPQKNCRRKWNTYRTISLLDYHSIFCLFLNILFNFWSFTLFHITLSHNNVQKLQKLSEGIITSQSRHTYPPSGEHPRKNKETFLPRISQCWKWLIKPNTLSLYLTPYPNTVTRLISNYTLFPQYFNEHFRFSPKTKMLSAAKQNRTQKALNFVSQSQSSITTPKKHRRALG